MLHLQLDGSTLSGAGDGKDGIFAWRIVELVCGEVKNAASHAVLLAPYGGGSFEGTDLASQRFTYSIFRYKICGYFLDTQRYPEKCDILVLIKISTC
jgi:hypothetical protein